MRLLNLIIVLCFILPVQATELTATTSLNRYSGLLIGDQITATVTLPVASTDIDRHYLPQHDKRQGLWLYLGEVQLEQQALILHYQVISVPAENRVVKTPEFQLRTTEGKFITVSPVNMQIGSFLPADKDGRVELTPQPDMMVPMFETRIHTLQFWAAMTVFFISSLTWIIWHFGLRPRQRLPFATAIFELNKMRLSGRKDAEQASRHLHHAFNRSAGRVLTHSQLDRLWLSCPWLQPEQEIIERFYAQSAAHFFSPKGLDKTPSFPELLRLAKACRALERLA